jgi:hypothetical protein
MKHLSIILLCLPCANLSTQAASADTIWNSADGILTLSIPDSKQFMAISPPSPLDAAWVSADRQTLLAVMRYEDNVNSGLDRMTEAKQLAAEIRGKVAWLPNHSINGFELWSIKGVGESCNIFQTMFRHDHIFYKIVVSTKSEPDQAVINHLCSLMSIRERSGITAQSDLSHVPKKELGAMWTFSPRGFAKVFAFLSVAIVSTLRLFRIW